MVENTFCRLVRALLHISGVNVSAINCSSASQVNSQASGSCGDEHSEDSSRPKANA